MLSFLFTAWLSGISKVFLDRFQIVLCLSVCPWAPKGESGIVKRRRGGKSHSISWTDHWSGWRWHVMTQTASFLPLLSRCWPYKWCCRLPPYAIKHAVKQDGVLSPSCAPRHPPQLSSLTFFRAEKQITAAVFSLVVFVHIYFLFSPSSSSSFPACVLLPPVSVGLRRGAEASLTGVWVLIAHVCALISGPQLPASSLFHASEWGYISLSLWPETFLSISLGLSPCFALSL